MFNGGLFHYINTIRTVKYLLIILILGLPFGDCYAQLDPSLIIGERVRVIPFGPSQDPVIGKLHDISADSLYINNEPWQKVNKYAIAKEDIYSLDISAGTKHYGGLGTGLGLTLGVIAGIPLSKRAESNSLQKKAECKEREQRTRQSQWCWAEPDLARTATLIGLSLAGVLIGYSSGKGFETEIWTPANIEGKIEPVLSINNTDIMRSDVGFRLVLRW